jgi:ribosome-associated protein
MTQAQTHPASSGPASAQVIDLVDAITDPLLKLVLQQLDDDQAQEVVTIDLEGKSSIADHMVIASGRSTRQVAAMAQKLAEKVKQAGFGPVKLEGLPAADWVLLDAGDVVVHLFRPEVRSFYNLERMWAFGDAPPVAGTA